MAPKEHFPAPKGMAPRPKVGAAGAFQQALWESGEPGGSESGAGAGVNCLTTYDLTKDDVPDIVVGRDDGAVQVFRVLGEGAGLAPEDVTHVVFTHCHPDHLWGVLDDFDEPLFYEAQYMMGRAEWDYWWNPETVNEIGEARAAFAVGAKRRMEAIEDAVTLFDDGQEVLPGIAAIASPGHTPGHMAFEVRQGSQAALVATTAGTYTLDGPLGLSFDFSVKFVTIKILFLPDCISPSFKCIKAFLIPSQNTSINP